MGFTQANSTVKKQRVKVHIFIFRNPARCGVGKLIWPADNKTVKGKTGIKRRAKLFFVDYFYLLAEIIRKLVGAINNIAKLNLFFWNPHDETSGLNLGDIKID